MINGKVIPGFGLKSKSIKTNDDTASEATDSQNELIVKGKYLVRERSWR